MELKRRSQEILQGKMQIVDIDIDEVDTMSDSGDEENTRSLNRKILCNYLPMLLHI